MSEPTCVLHRVEELLYADFVRRLKRCYDGSRSFLIGNTVWVVAVWHGAQ